MHGLNGHILKLFFAQVHGFTHIYELLLQIGEQHAGANQFLGGKGLGIQQGTSVWVGSPKSGTTWLRSCLHHGP